MDFIYVLKYHVEYFKKGHRNVKKFDGHNLLLLIGIGLIMQSVKVPHVLIRSGGPAKNIDGFHLYLFPFKFSFIYIALVPNGSSND